MRISKIDLTVTVLLLAVSVFFMTDRGGGAKKLYLISAGGKKQIEMKPDLIKLDGGDVLIEVTAEGARFIESDCPNKICIKHGWVTGCSDTAVCVPNKYALVIECSEEEYDAVSQ